MLQVTEKYVNNLFKKENILNAIVLKLQPIYSTVRALK